MQTVGWAETWGTNLAVVLVNDGEWWVSFVEIVVVRVEVDIAIAAARIKG
jgi:hypothetical protein